MPSITLALPDELKKEIQRLSWINWSEMIRLELSKKLKRDRALNRLTDITKKSKLSKKDVDMLAEELKKSLLKAYDEE